MHESTVSRVTNNKTVQTPRGIFQLKYFFSSSLSTEGGEEVSAKAAKSRIQEIVSKEAFGPVAVLSPFDDFDEALRQVNDSVFGLQAGIFTRDLYRAQRAWDELEVGGVVIGDVPSWRVDHMPYGGVKDSGLGREGIRFAIEDMTEVRLLVVRTPA